MGAAGAYLTASPAARQLGVSDQTIRNWAKRGKLPYAVTDRGTKLFRPEDVEKLARELRKQQPQR
jgi:excisionase family DNA binding protein